MELILVRHAEPLAGTDLEASPADPPLSPTGRLQARALARWIADEGVDQLVSSPALRARQTALMVADVVADGMADGMAERADLEVAVDQRLRDASADAQRYVPIEADKERDPLAYRARLQAYRESPRLEAMAARVAEALAEWASRCAGQRVAVFCHGSVINVYAAQVLGLAPRAFLAAEHASAHRFLVSRSGVRSVRTLNETAYLPRPAALQGPL